MTGKNCSGFDFQQSHPKQVDKKRIFRNQSRMRNSVESIFSCVTNVSDTGTYEIEICERQSRDTCSLSRRAICSKTPIESDVSKSDVSKCHGPSKSVRSVLPSKSDNSIVDPRKTLTRSKNRLVQSYYPCFCIATLELKDNPKPKADLVNKETNTTNTGAEYSGQASKSVSSSSIISSKKDNDEFSSAVDSEKTRTGSRCSSSSRSSSCSSGGAASLSDSGSSFQRNKQSSRKTSPISVTSKSNTAGSVDTEKSCDCTKCRYRPTESSGTYIVVSDDKKTKESQIEKNTDNIFERMRTVQALELISEEKEKQWTEGVGEFRSCKCEMSRYEERLKNLENLHLSSNTAGDDDKRNKEFEAESHKRSCECATTLIQFTEIKSRIEALEKLCMDKLGNKSQSTKGNKEEKPRSEVVTEDDSYIEDGKSKCETKSLTETLDEAARTAIELAKIKKRLMDLEAKMLQEKTYCTSSSPSIMNNASFGKDKNLAVNITTTYITPPNNKLSDKEIQVIDLNGEQNRPARAREDYGFIAENRMAAYWIMKKMNPWGKIVLRDEAIQTPSKKQVEDWSADCEYCPKPREKKKKSKKSCDRIHLCKECNFYISQKIGRPRGESLEKLWKSRKLDESLPVKSKKFASENINKLKKSFNLYQINTSEFLAGRDSKKLSFFNETRRLLEKKREKERKKLKLCPKCSKTNLKESVISDYESELEHGRYPWICNSNRLDKSHDSLKNRNTNIKKDPKKSFRSIRMPHQSFQIYKTQETSHSLLLHPRSSRARTFSSRHRRKVNYDEDKGLSRNCPFRASPCYPMKVLYNSHHPPFSWATSYGSWEKNTCYTVTASAVKDSTSICSGSHKKKNRLNPFQYLRAGRKIKIPVLFEEICHSSENSLLEDKSNMSMRVVQVGVKEEVKNGLSPFRKLVRKFSHSQSMACTEKLIPFGISKCCCENTFKANRKALETQKKTNLFSLVRRSCPH